jgi:hypothetical protein
MGATRTADPLTERAAGLEPHEVLAVISTFCGEMHGRIQSLEDDLETLERLIDAAVIRLAGPEVVEAGLASFAADERAEDLMVRMGLRGADDA